MEKREYHKEKIVSIDFDGVLAEYYAGKERNVLEIQTKEQKHLF